MRKYAMHAGVLCLLMSLTAQAQLTAETCATLPSHIRTQMEKTGECKAKAEKPLNNSSSTQTKTKTLGNAKSFSDQACEQVDWSEYRPVMGFDTEYTDLWPVDRTSIDNLRRQVLVSIESQKDAILANEMRRMSGEKVPDRVADIIEGASWTWLASYYSLKDQHPAWGHDEWKLGSLPSITCAESDLSGACKGFRQKSKALDIIHRDQISMAALVDVASKIVGSLNACEESFNSLPPSLSRALAQVGRPEEMCETAFAQGVFTEKMSSEAIADAAQQFWAPKIPKEIPMGQWGIIASDPLRLLRVRDVQIISGADFLEANYEAHNQYWKGRVWTSAYAGAMIVTVDVIDARPAIYSEYKGRKESWPLYSQMENIRNSSVEKVSVDGEVTEIYCGRLLNIDIELLPGQGVPAFSYAIALTENPNLEELYLGNGQVKFKLK